MNTSCESTNTLELREFSLATSAAIGRCWQSTDWPTTKFVTGFCALLADSILHTRVMLMILRSVIIITCTRKMVSSWKS